MPRWWRTAATVVGSWSAVLGLLLRCEVVFVLSPESAEKDSELSTLSCLDVIIDSTLQTDARPAMTIFLNFCAKNDVFSDICFENKMAHNVLFLFPHKRTHTHSSEYLFQPCLCCFVLTSSWTEPFGNTASSPQVQRGRAGLLCLATMTVSCTLLSDSE